jgi:uncharacterized integral membrane protein (TIGR00698 family)
MTSTNNANRKLSTLEKNLFGVSIKELPTLFPGLLAVAALTWLSTWLSDLIGIELMGLSNSPISPVMIAIVLGLALGALLPLPKTLKPGLQFTIKKILRLGIIMLGIRLTIFDVFKLGAFGVPIVAFCIIGALIITTWINTRMRLPERLGTLIAVGTSICGVTAIVATSPAIEADEEETAYAVAVITVFGLFATLVYPYLANFLFLEHPLEVGLFLGTSVHETAQVVGAAQIYADIFSESLVLDVATVTKLVRNVFMAAVIPAMAYYYARKARATEQFQGQKTSVAKLFPMFILGFLAMAGIRSLGDAAINAGLKAFGMLDSLEWNAIIDFIKSWAGIFLVAALAGVGLNTDFRSFRALGIRPFVVGLGASLAVGLLSYLAISLLGSLVTF